MPDDFHSGEASKTEREQFKLSRQNIALRIALLQASLEALNNDLNKRFRNPSETSESGRNS